MLLAALPGQSWAAETPSAKDALKLAPRQADVEFDRPKEADLAKCVIKAEAVDGRTGWVVRGPSGQILRQFIDTSGDNVVDLWCYYSDGLEVYRDIDSNFNGKADQYRWMNTAGTRWGLDDDEDGKIDAWKQISAEEVSAEAVAALARRDMARFRRLLLTDEELKALGLGPEKASAIGEKIAAAPAAFSALAGHQKALSAKANWVQFGGTRPALIPSGSEGSSKDLLVYENVISTTDTDGKLGQVVIGTLVRVGDVWRLIGSPEMLDDTKGEFASSGSFLVPYGRTRAGGGATGGVDEKTQQLLQRLEQLDKQAGKAASEKEQAAIAVERCDLLEQIANSSVAPADRAQWIRSLAESISAGVQAGTLPDGITRLKTLYEQLSQEKGSEDVAAYVRFRQLTSQYNEALQAGGDFPKVQKKWLASLRQYVTDYPQSEDAAEAMLQLGTNEEFAGEEEEAKKWYGQIVDGFPKSGLAQKAAGAIHRLNSVGTTLRLHGAGVTGKPVDLNQFRKKVVLVHYWATWCEPCKAELAQIKEAVAKYGKDGFTVISISLDNRKEDLTGYLRKHPLPWSHIYEEGGYDSRLASELGVITLPTMLLIDRDGKVVNRGINATELDHELKGLVRGQ
jgi:thiol-disulfide isomerase/thioredoxin